jgi:hypothetical protein
VEKEHLNSNDRNEMEKYEFFNKFLEKITQIIVIKFRIKLN